MPATRYKIWKVGHPVGRGATAPLHVGVAGVAKQGNHRHPAAVANELICGHLARILLLPVPPGFVIEHDGEPHHVSLNFNLSGEDLPPANAPRLVAAHPRLATGILLFDMWIANGDRHTGNIAFDEIRNVVQVFDHSHAFFNGTDGRGHLTNALGDWGVGNHCLAPHMTGLEGLDNWIARIDSVPDYYLRGVVEAASDVGLPTGDVDFCVGYLNRRRGELETVLRNNMDRLPNVQPVLLDEDNGGGPQ